MKSFVADLSGMKQQHKAVAIRKWNSAIITIIISIEGKWLSECYK